MISCFDFKVNEEEATMAYLLREYRNYHHKLYMKLDYKFHAMHINFITLIRKQTVLSTLSSTNLPPHS